MAKALIIDDEKTYCYYLSQILEREGYEVRSALTGHDGLDMTQTFVPDVLIVDWMLKDDYDGIQVAEAIRRTNPNLQTIIITGFSAEDPQREAGNTQVFRYLEKPFEIQDVLNAVHDALQQAGTSA